MASGELSPILQSVLAPLAQISEAIGSLAVEDLPFAQMVSPDFNVFLPFATSAIYFIRSDSKGLLYIGGATDVRQRWRYSPMAFQPSVHHRVEDAVALGDCKLHWMAVPKQYLGLFECLFINHYKPPWNSQK